MAEIGNVTVRVDAVITDEQYREAMGAVKAANERMDLIEDENAKLREQLDVAEHNQTRNAREYARLCHENDKLRELIDILCFCMQIHKRCDDCKLNGAKGELGLGHDPLLACDGLHEMLKELGIEVD